MMMRLSSLSVLATVVALCASATFAQTAPAAEPSAESPAAGGLYIKIGEANLKKSLMAIPPFQYTGSPSTAKGGIRFGKDLYDVFRNDMETSAFFEFIKPDAYIEDPNKVGLKPAPGESGGFNFASWKQIGAEFLVRVGFRVIGDDLTVDTFTYFVPQQKLVMGKSYKGRSKDSRAIAHTFANDLVKALTGQQGMFLSKIVTSRSTAPSQKEIFIMDWDGANAKQISTHKSIAQSPTWSFNGQSIAYSAFAYHANEKTRNLDLFTFDTTTGKRFLVSYRRGLNSGASYMPDDKHLLLTISQGGNPDIYKMSLDGKTLTRLTTGKAGELNVEAAPSPDGKKIAFSSTRSGQPMIFVMNSDGTDVKRLTFAGVYNSTPAWSPDSKRIAFAGFDDKTKNYDIFSMDISGGNLARLTSAKKKDGRLADNEDPSFSPDGRHVLFRSNRTGKYQLYVVSADGEDERRITFDQHEYFRPRWSPTFE